MEVPSITFESLSDFGALPTIRQLFAEHRNTFNISDIDLALLRLNELPTLEDGYSIQKKQALSATSSSTKPIAEFVTALHKLAHTILANFSHALNMPWESFLGEMHELNERGSDELRVFGSDTPIPNDWSTMIILLNTSYPNQVTVVCGEALSVFSNGVISAPKQSFLEPQLLPIIESVVPREWIAYYVRPNADVFYSPAGAEDRTGERVREVEGDLLRSSL
ncbi:hypothetical protein BJY01DRAFT_250567 [Aspergillus pseudoustus]|uniref:Uncharacterized protein n=1 Tax=Aspergillus pseudoustus TaxID=1810923 RepID=A0ABR4JGU2_9EURO